MESIIVGVIVALAALWALGRMLGKRRAPAACGSSMGCDGCSCASKPPADPRRLVSLRR